MNTHTQGGNLEEMVILLSQVSNHAVVYYHVSHHIAIGNQTFFGWHSIWLKPRDSWFSDRCLKRSYKVSPSVRFGRVPPYHIRPTPTGEVLRSKTLTTGIPSAVCVMSLLWCVERLCWCRTAGLLQATYARDLALFPFRLYRLECLCKLIVSTPLIAHQHRPQEPFADI